MVFEIYWCDWKLYLKIIWESRRKVKDSSTDWLWIFYRNQYELHSSRIDEI